MLTEYILKKCPELSILSELSDPHGLYHMINSGGVETEVGEWLYALVRMIKPKLILETGTYFGVSSSFMGMALKTNGFGKIITVDYVLHDEATYMWNKLELEDVIEYWKALSLDVNLEQDVDILFLDTEPHIRFQEFVHFFPRVKAGGLILVHDLHSHLSYNPEMDHWPYGDFRPSIGNYIKRFEVQTISFPTPRGLTMFQKESPVFSCTQLLRNEI